MKVVNNTNTIVISDDDDLTVASIVKAQIVKIGFNGVTSKPRNLNPNAKQSSYKIELALSNGEHVVIPLGSLSADNTANNVSNQVTWTDDLAGARIAQSDINGWLN